MAHCGEELVLELAGALRFFLGLEQGVLGALLQGDIAEDDDAAPQSAILTLKRSARNTEQTTVRHFRVADEDLYCVNSLTPHCPHQGQFVGWIQRHGVR